MKEMLLQVQKHEYFSIIQVICVGHLVLKTGINSLTGAAELVGPVQTTTTTNQSEEKPHLHSANNTEVRNRQIHGRSKINETEAA